MRNYASIIGIVTKIEEITTGTAYPRLLVTLRVNRFSAKCDYIGVVVPNSLGISAEDISMGETLQVSGILQSYPRADGRYRAAIRCYKVEHVSDETEHINNVELAGTLSKSKHTGRPTIAGGYVRNDKIRIERAHSGRVYCDTVPFVTWDSVAEAVEDMEDGSAVGVVGRLQERDIRISDTIYRRTEIAVKSISALN